MFTNLIKLKPELELLKKAKKYTHQQLNTHTQAFETLRERSNNEFEVLQEEATVYLIPKQLTKQALP